MTSAVHREPAEQPLLGGETATGTGVLIKTGNETRDEKEADCLLSPASLRFPQNLALETTLPSEKLEIEKGSNSL